MRQIKMAKNLKQWKLSLPESKIKLFLKLPLIIRQLFYTIKIKNGNYLLLRCLLRMVFRF